MKVLFLSDLHLGSPLFKSGRKILELLRDASYDEIYLNGDIVDVWEQDMDTIIANNATIIQTIIEQAKIKNVYFTKGNHEPSKDELRRLFPDCIVDDKFQFQDGMIIHGHEYDDLATKYLWLAKILFIPHWILQRFGINLKAFFRNLYYSVSNKIKKKYYQDLVLDIEKEAVKDYRNDYKFVMLGHSHFPKIHTEPDGFKYLNSGDWIHNKTYIEYKNGNFKLMQL